MASPLKSGDIVVAKSPKSDKHGVAGWYKGKKKRVTVAYSDNIVRHFAPHNVEKYEGEVPDEIASCKQYQELLVKERGDDDAPPSESVLSMKDMTKAILDIAEENEEQAEQLEVHATLLKEVVARVLVLEKDQREDSRALSNLTARIDDYDKGPAAAPAKRARQKNLPAALIEN